MNNRSFFAILAISTVVTATVVTACTFDVDIDLGESVTQEIDVPAFDSIRVDAPFEVTIRQGETQRVEIEVAEGLLDDVQVDVEDGQLVIDLDSGLFTSGGKLEARITVLDLATLDLSGASDTVIVALVTDELGIDLTGASELVVSGQIERLDLRVSGASDADFGGTSIDAVSLDVSGASNVEFDDTVTDIAGSISGASELTVDEDTNVSVDTSGASSIDRN